MFKLTVGFIINACYTLSSRLIRYEFATKQILTDTFIVPGISNIEKERITLGII